jgi:hypothetical protein
MSGLNREDFIELGVSIPTAFVTEWASGQVAATQGRESRLEMRGVSAAYLAGIRDLVDVVGKRQRELGERHDLPPEAAALAERIRHEAAGYWREAKRLAAIAFAVEPDVLAKFRTGVRTGLLLENLARELESTLGLLREHASVFAGLGAREAFVTRGELLLARIRQAKSRLDATCRDLPLTAAQQCHDKGLLFDLTRRLVRVGRLEFTLEPEQAADFNFKLLRRDRGLSSRPRQKKTPSDKR